MNYQLPNRKKFSELNEAERAYFEAMAKSEAQKLLGRVSGSEDFKRLVAANLSAIATPKPAQSDRQSTTQVTTQGPSQAFEDYMSGSDDSQVPRRSLFGGDQ